MKTKKPLHWLPRRAKASDLHQISLFFKQQYQGPQTYGRADMFNWKTLGNYIQPGFINIIKDNETIAATTSMVPKKLLLNSRFILSGEIGDTYVDQIYRKEGLFPLLGNATRKEAIKENMQFIYGLPNHLALPGWLKRNSFLLMDSLNVRSMVFPLSVKPKFQRLIGWVLAEVLDLIYRIFACLIIFSKKIHFTANQGYLIEPINYIPKDWDLFWSYASKYYDFIFDRSSKSIQWRYLENPEKYSFFTIRYQNELVGYFITSKTITRNGLDLTIVDFLFIKSHERALNLCLESVFNDCFQTSVRAINVWCEKTSPYYSIFKKWGLRDQRKVPVIFYCESISDQIENIKNPHFSIGDSDNA